MKKKKKEEAEIYQLHFERIREEPKRVLAKHPTSIAVRKEARQNRHFDISRANQTNTEEASITPAGKRIF